MLNVEPKALWSEIESAERFRDAHLSRVDSMIEQYVGDSYRTDLNGQWSENSFYEFIRLTTGKIIFDNPKFRVNCDLPDEQDDIAQAIRWGLNGWARKSKLRRLLKRVYAAQSFAFSVVQTVIEPQPWADPRVEPMKFWPQCYVLEQNRWFFDPLCTWYGGARFAGHKFVRDKEDLIKEAEEFPDRGWNVDMLKSISSDAGLENFKRGNAGERSSLTRNEIVLYECWVPEINTQDPSMGFHGTIYTIPASPTEDEYIRKPRPFYGARSGPYTLFGVYPVPGDPFPLSPFQATRMQSQELNDVVRGTNKAIREYKRLVLCSAENPDLAMKLKKPDNVVLTIKGFTKDQVEQIELGGVTEQHLKQLEITLARVDRATGVNQTQQGKITGATATELSIQDSANEAGMAYIKQEFADAVVQLAETVGHSLMHDDRITFPLGQEAATKMGMRQPWFQGGPSAGQQFSDGDFEYEIEPYSMERLNEALLQAQYSEMMQMAIEAAAVIPTAPFYDWKKLFDKGGEVMNDPSFGDFYNAQVGQGMQMMNIQQQQMEQQQAQSQMQQDQMGAQQDQGMAQQDMAIAGQQHGAKMATEAVKRHAVLAGVKDKHAITRATVQQKKLQGRSYGAKVGAARSNK